jgi:purine-nucleoside phosphorylase
VKERLQDIFSKMKQYNSDTMYEEVFGLSGSVVYDALVVAPGWKPTRIIADTDRFSVRILAEHSYVSGYEVTVDGLRIGWIQCASGACNLLDHLLLCADLSFRTLIFVGAVGSLVEEIPFGSFCTPSVSIRGVYTDAYFSKTLGDFTPFARVYPPQNMLALVRRLAAERSLALTAAPVFCTDSIACEYAHLSEIRAMGAQLIEMETSTFYRLADMMEVPAIALLVVSDNSACGTPLVGRGDEVNVGYRAVRSTVIPEVVAAVAAEARARGWGV